MCRERWVASASVQAGYKWGNLSRLEAQSRRNPPALANRNIDAAYWQLHSTSRRLTIFNNPSPVLANSPDLQTNWINRHAIEIPFIIKPYTVIINQPSKIVCVNSINQYLHFHILTANALSGHRTRR